MSRSTGMEVETSNLADLPGGPVVEAVLAAGATLASGATTAALTGTVGAAAAATATATVCSGALEEAATPSTKEELPQESAMEVCTRQDEASPETLVQVAARWDAHLDNPNTQADPKLHAESQSACRGRHGICSKEELKFTEQVEFISLGCYCAPSYALQLLGLKRYSYPFDWVRSSVEGVLHCLDVQFQDFLTYSTTWTQDQYMVFGGTRWGGSFWHHNLEAPVTREDMIRRVRRLYGQGEVPADRPRLFVRSVNSTRELEKAFRLREALKKLVPDASQVMLLLIVDLQSCKGPMAVSADEGAGILVYQVAEADTCKAVAQGAAGLAICSESYAEAVGFAVQYWSGSAGAQARTKTFGSFRDLGAACEQWDGGDPGRELFTPRKFYGQCLDMLSEMPKMVKLCAPLQLFNFVLQADVNPKVPLNVECFGKYLQVTLPEGSVGGHILQLYNNEGTLTGTVGLLVQDGQVLPLGPALVEEKTKAAPTESPPARTQEASQGATF